MIKFNNYKKWVCHISRPLNQHQETFRLDRKVQMRSSLTLHLRLWLINRVLGKIEVRYATVRQLLLLSNKMSKMRKNSVWLQIRNQSQKMRENFINRQKRLKKLINLKLHKKSIFVNSIRPKIKQFKIGQNNYHKNSQNWRKKTKMNLLIPILIKPFKNIWNWIKVQMKY